VKFLRTCRTALKKIALTSNRFFRVFTFIKVLPDLPGLIRCTREILATYSRLLLVR
jgi:hypothetical protein